MGIKIRIAPVKVGEEHTVKIISVGKRGDGVAKIENFVIFVPHTKKGDEVRVKITKVLGDFAFAEKV
ncbi:MAG: TRAM domain-containing protein [Candidatus Parvarchaeota archaeon]|nr:TRAM domain-containing protein [Candidatus Haiyanarchaeum thermophilum]MCW1303149.1 TRAM domain-containing protein [Candidatus Haiyanarchaeum thermophilum]MCW1303814.1 TRAM domain-containing protein [Candidatus Haiyanarchaeum thermophilum]MCW1306569.1 TRAM domain-containing protein [Candidatus Haiyanarchaeum thermophilum]MCW1306983.1 TRAM domain-containing protein [Candidatus Haiyanarchaeum thermophilum]